jgi:hypothetical protein
MPFVPPSFNLMCNVWHMPNTPPSPADFTVKCNLAWGKRVAPGESFSAVLRTLLLPLGTDVRPLVVTGSFPTADAIECPAGTRRYYRIWDVDDIGKGFPNEHRVVLMVAIPDYGLWPHPIP